MSVCKLESQWQTVHYLACPMGILKCLKFPPLISEPWVCAEESKSEHAQDRFLATVAEGVVHGVYKIVTQFWCNTTT